MMPSESDWTRAGLNVIVCHQSLNDRNDMMETFGVAEAKRRFGELLDRVARGERFVIERRGKPAVALVRPEEAPPDRLRPRGVLSLLGLFSDWSQAEAEEMVGDIYRERRRAKDRPAPDLG